MNDNQNEYMEEREELNELMAVRREKLKDLYDSGINPFGERFVRTHCAQEILDNFDSMEDQETVIAGRIMSLRTHGKASFADLMDSSGRIQL
ncbi:MAG: lysine--tRNA ligase, partial [Firmicutes bacterium]|nr:lysine--tRNA ligase [Bacillota bacterium]